VSEWSLDDVTGFGFTGVRTSRIDLPGRRGTTPSGADLLPSKVVTVEASIECGDPETADTAVRDLLVAWQPSAVNVDLWCSVAGLPRRRVSGRPLSAEIMHVDLEHGVVAANCSFDATGGVWLSEVVRSVALGVTGRNVGNLVAPLIAPLSSTLEVVEDLGSVVQVRNDGSTAADWTASIDGPVTDLDLVLDGRTVSVVGTVEDGSTMTIDSATRVVKVDGVPVQGWVSVLSDWWQIDPGVHTLEFQAVSGLGTATVSWSDTWL
jgi:hypothetical protein